MDRWRWIDKYRGIRERCVAWIARIPCKFGRHSVYMKYFDRPPGTYDTHHNADGSVSYGFGPHGMHWCRNCDKRALPRG